MTGGKNLGCIFWKFGLKSSLQQDIGVAKAEIKSFTQFVDDGYGGMRKMTDRELKAMARTATTTANSTKSDFKKMGNAVGEEMEKGTSFVRGMGASIIGMAAAAKMAGIDIDGMEKPLMNVGVGMTVVGSGAELAGKGIKAYTAYTTTTAIPALYAQAAAAWAAHGPLVLLTGLGVGAVLAFSSVGRSAETASEKLRGNEQAINDLRSAYQKYYDQQAEYAEIPEELSDLERDLTKAKIDAADADQAVIDAQGQRGQLSKDLEKAMTNEVLALSDLKDAQKMTPEERRLSPGAEALAKYRYEDTKAARESIEEQISRIDSGLDNTMNRRILAQQEAYDRVADIQKKIDEKTARRGELKLTMPAFYDYTGQVGGYTGPTAKPFGYDIIGGAGEYYFTQPQKRSTVLGILDFLLPNYKELPEIPAAQYYSKPTTGAYESMYPVGSFRDIVIQINGTVTNKTLTIPGSTLQDQAKLQGF